MCAYYVHIICMNIMEVPVTAVSVTSCLGLGNFLLPFPARQSSDQLFPFQLCLLPLPLAPSPPPLHLIQPPLPRLTPLSLGSCYSYLCSRHTHTHTAGHTHRLILVLPVCLVPDLSCLALLGFTGRGCTVREREMNISFVSPLEHSHSLLNSI